MENYYPDLAKLSAKNNAKLLHEEIVATLRWNINYMIDKEQFREAWATQKTLDKIMNDYNQEVHWLTKPTKVFIFQR